MLHGAAESCRAVQDTCGADLDVDGIDRRADGTVRLTVEVASDVLGPVSMRAEADGAGPFPAFEHRPDDGVKISRFRAEWIGPRLYEVVGEVVCAPPATRMRFLSEVCDLDRATPYCFPYEVNDYAYGHGSIGFRYDGSYNWDLVRVTFDVEDLPERRVVFRF
jgi:hypothetical protein